jgi:hypothetical protein
MSEISDQDLIRLIDRVDNLAFSEPDVHSCRCGAKFVELGWFVDFLTEMAEEVADDRKQEVFIGLRSLARQWRDS